MDDKERLERKKAREQLNGPGGSGAGFSESKTVNPVRAGFKKFKADNNMGNGKNSQTRGKESLQKNIVRELLETSVYLLVVLVMTYLFITFVGQRTVVSGSSMEATLSDGDNLIVDKISYRFTDPKRFDIIVFPYKHMDDTFYIKRIIGMPGETVYIDFSGNIYINDEVLEEDYGREVMEQPGRAYEPITLGDDEYFVLGDNRNNSSDSRDPSVGNIKRKELIGRAFVRILPLSKAGILKHQ